MDQTEGESPTEPDAKKKDAIAGAKVLPKELEGKSQGLKTPAQGTPSDLAKRVADDLNADAAAVVGQEDPTRHGYLIIKPAPAEEQ